MYLVVIHVPFYLRGEEVFVTSPWKRSLELLRDSFNGSLGPITVLAPSLPAELENEQVLEPISAAHDEITPVASFDGRCRARWFWMRDKARWVADIESLLPRARVVHSGLDDLWRPISFLGHVHAVRAGLPTVFVQDNDIALRMREMARGAGFVGRARTEAHAMVYERVCRWGVTTADLSLIKGRSAMDRYAGFARCARAFHDTSHSLADTISDRALEQRLAAPRQPGALRLVFCGRLVTIKGLRESISIVAGARRLGAPVTLDIIGDGPDRSSLAQFAADAGVGGAVHFLGGRPYGPALLAELASYDGLIFTPPGDETPRMIFDGLAAGLPLLAFDTAYARQLADEDRCCVLLPHDDLAESSSRVAALAHDPAALADLSRLAATAGRHHAADSWYRRRAEWTLEAVAAANATSRR